MEVVTATKVENQMFRSDTHDFKTVDSMMVGAKEDVARLGNRKVE